MGHKERARWISSAGTGKVDHKRGKDALQLRQFSAIFKVKNRMLMKF
jgi:hypothetical protein